ncbi:hypothetical protein QX249_11940 [Vibrio parahaemolyticus]|uniref:Uncharacterized protein n=1 Tax=Vibrio parahaemolyticus TaxID=670 RepID=A0AAW8PYT9_VIBPH|nr:hypothetical protein [Vibrio parahaemolyticus]EGR2227323.1 hypothetical protein [Vibrio parahaemolyticus]MDS1821372.1 hypothetical protein [Vibrio parahaemolyticus]
MIDTNKEADLNTKDDEPKIRCVKLDRPILFEPYIEKRRHDDPIDPSYTFKLDAKLVNPFVDELVSIGKKTLITDTLQSLWTDADGTLLLTAFPDFTSFKAVVSKMNSIPNELKDMITKWEEIGADEIYINFEHDLSQRNRKTNITKEQLQAIEDVIRRHS